MKILRTDPSRFSELPDFAYAPRSLDIPFGDAQVSMAYVDEGPRNGPIVLLLHGEPSWSFLYRKMIAVLVDQGCRAIAPDLVGFGRSDKPASSSDYSYARHVQSITAFIEQLDLNELTLFCQDWGGLIGLRVVAEHSQRFARVIAANTFLPTGDGKAGLPFLVWRQFAKRSPAFPIGRLVSIGCARSLTAGERAAYDAPFPDASFKAGARAFPLLVPIRPDDPAAEANRAAWRALERFDKPFLTLFSTGDPMTRGLERFLQRRIPGAKNLQHTLIAAAGHFLQEDAGEALAQRLAAFARGKT